MVFKKGHLILGAVTLLMSFAFIYLTFFTYGEKTVTTFSTPAAGKIFVIDPGHGGIDAGASEGDAVEKELNLKIALYLKEFIEENGGIAILTRTTDTNTADPERPKNISQKKSDLMQRKELPKKSGADAFISIHINKFSDSKYSGAQVFCAPNSEESQALGEIMQASLIKNADPKNIRQLKTGNSIYILKDATVPSILVECGFLSNPDEAQLLMTESYQQKIAWAIFMGLTEYYVQNR